MTEIISLTKRETHDWELFADWCASMSSETNTVQPMPATAETIADFLGSFPAPIETQGRRVRAIRKSHERARRHLALPHHHVAVLREGDNWADVPRAIAQAPKYQYPKSFQDALRGRRDAWLLVLVGVVGLTRNAARTLDHTDVQLFPEIAIKGIPIPRHADPTECPACAVTRWLRVTGAASFGFWNEVKDVVRPRGHDESTHDCTTGLDGSWRQASTLLPSIDRHGWASADPLSARSVSAIVAARQTLGPIAVTADELIYTPTTGRYAEASLGELADAYDDVDEKVAEALLRLKGIVDASDDRLEHLKDISQ